MARNMVEEASVVEAARELAHVVTQEISKYDHSHDPNDLDFLIYKLTQLYKVLLASNVDTSVLERLSRCFTLLNSIQECSLPGTGYFPQTITSGRGRPKFDITCEQLEHLLEIGLNCPTIAACLGVSLRTIRRRMSDYDLSVSGLYSTISDADLDQTVKEIQTPFPNCGVRMLHGHLRSRGIRVTQERIRASLHRTDPSGSVVRWATTIQRRRYCVAGPLSLWHIDGNHKLIRWKLVVHGGVDGFSRIPVFLECSNNNKASTVLTAFLTATAEYGLPSRVRCDKGGENTSVSEYMLLHPMRGPGRGTVIVGRSVHNQRIERLWRDVYEGVLKLYYDLFYHLEDTHLLDVLDDVSLFCLHYIFIPRINRHLCEWKQAWIHHPMTSMNSSTPMQLWTQGLLALCGGTHLIGRELFEDLSEVDDVETFGIDWDGPSPLDDDNDDNTIEVPAIDNPISDSEYDALQQAIDPLVLSNTFGIDLFISTMQFIHNLH